MNDAGELKKKFYEPWEATGLPDFIVGEQPVVLKDLRVGNNIVIRNADLVASLIKVDAGHLAAINFGASHYFPLVLKGQMLEKLGFTMALKETNKSREFRKPRALPADMVKGKFVLTAGHHEWWYWQTPHNVRIDYVHQLQNLYFSLTGEELEVKL